MLYARIIRLLKRRVGINVTNIRKPVLGEKLVHYIKLISFNLQYQNVPAFSEKWVYEHL